VLECLQRALRVSDSVVDAAVMVELFVEVSSQPSPTTRLTRQVLNRYLYYFEQENETITVRFVNGLIELIHSNLHSAESSPSLDNARRHFERTLDYVKSREYEGVVAEAPSAA
jgi:vacuolar protein sorting-associated protein 35